jgi:hypothetical protein
MFNTSTILLAASSNKKVENPIGGGEILNFFGQNEQEWTRMNGELIGNLQRLGLYKFIIVLLILIIFCLVAMKLLGIRTVVKDAAVRAELDNVKTLKKTEKNIVNQQKQLNKLKNLIHSFGLSPGDAYVDYMNYNLRRAGVMAPGGDRPLDAFEFNALIKTGLFVTEAVLLFVTLFINAPIGAVLMLITAVCWSTFPTVVIRSKAAERDKVIKDNFFEFYQEIHYILINGGKTSISKRMRSFAKSVRSKPELVQFAETCADLFDIYGESEGAARSAKEFKEIPDVGKLMRLIQQFNEGADIKNDLMGFRETLLLKHQMKLEEEQKKIINQARASYSVIYVVLYQAIFSAMLIYVKDIVGAGSLMG